jgi:hypothetical protein
MKYACAGLLAFLVVGCASYRFSASGPLAGASKPPTCDFQIVNLPPGPGFQEIGTLNPDGDGLDIFPDKFKEHVRTDVCRVGGDLVVTEVNGKGQYVRGTVLRKIADATPTPAAAPAAGS